ncbi:hypothetical protein MTO96_013318 [Rhipicephalus appendiculatus]
MRPRLSLPPAGFPQKWRFRSTCRGKKRADFSDGLHLLPATRSPGAALLCARWSPVDQGAAPLGSIKVTTASAGAPCPPLLSPGALCGLRASFHSREAEALTVNIWICCGIWSWAEPCVA